MNFLTPENKSVLLFFLIAITILLMSIPVIIIAITFFPITIILGLAIKYTPLNKVFSKLYKQIYDYLFYKSEKPRKILWGFIYDFMCAYFPLNKWRALNYGYALLNENGRILNNLDEQQEEERFCLQLYHMVATNCMKTQNLSGKRILEVGSGRGGGLCYISQALKPAYCAGVDYSQNQVEFCKRTYGASDKLQYFQGDAENLDVLNFQSFDLIINVESSHCYGNFTKFVQQVTNLLNKGGMFIITDFRAIEEIPQFEKDLKSTGLQLETKEDITVNVIQALKLDEKRKQQWMHRHCGFLFRGFFSKFSGVQSSRIFQEFHTRKTLYMIYALKKV